MIRLTSIHPVMACMELRVGGRRGSPSEGLSVHETLEGRTAHGGNAAQQVLDHPPLARMCRYRSAEGLKVHTPKQLTEELVHMEHMQV